MAELKLGDNQFAVVTLKPDTRDKRGNPASQIDPASVTWLVDNPNILEGKTEDPMQMTMTAVGPLGEALVTMKAKTVDGQDVVGTIKVSIISEAPASVDFDIAPPQEQADPTPPADPATPPANPATPPA